MGEALRVQPDFDDFPEARLRLLRESPTSSSFGLETLVKFGYQPEYEAARAELLKTELGPHGARIARFEQEQNRQAWAREFLLDEPTSLPRSYWHEQGALFSFPHAHELTSIQSGIHPSERDGGTVEGFRAYQELITDSSDPNEVVLWYSPAGIGGSKDGFENLYYEAGRLYIGFKTDNQRSVHFDIKVQEGEDVQFPILRLLNHISGNTSISLYDYLHNPVKGGSRQIFLNLIRNLPENVGITPDTSVYISRRHEKRRKKDHSWGDILDEVEEGLAQELVHDYSHLTDDLPDSSSADSEVVTDPHKIHQAFQILLEDFAIENGLQTVHLYGCSQTSTIALDSQLSRTDVVNGSLFSSAQRMGTSQENTQPESVTGKGKATCPGDNCGKVVVFKRSEVIKTRLLQCPHCSLCARGCDAVEIAKKAKAA